MKWVPLTSASASFGASSIGSSAGVSRAPRARREPPSSSMTWPSPTSGEERVRRRREVAAGSERARARDDRHDARVQELGRRARPRAGGRRSGHAAGRSAGRRAPPARPPPAAALRRRPRGFGARRAAVETASSSGDALADERAEARRDAVDRVAARRSPPRARRGSRRRRSSASGSSSHRCTFDGDPPHGRGDRGPAPVRRRLRHRARRSSRTRLDVEVRQAAARARRPRRPHRRASGRRARFRRPRCPGRARLRGDPLDDVVRRRALPVLEVHAHLHQPGARQLETEGAHARKAAVALPDEARDLTRERRGRASGG